MYKPPCRLGSIFAVENSLPIFVLVFIADDFVRFCGRTIENRNKNSEQKSEPKSEQQSEQQSEDLPSGL